MIYFAAMTGAGGLLARLSRISSSGRFIPEIDGLRFVAISGVVLFHLTMFLDPRMGTVPRGRFGDVVSQGFFGVQLFFVISGFILALPFAESRLEGSAPVSLGRYYGRRLSRLEPPYAINLLVLFLIMVLTGEGTASVLWRHLAASLFYVHAPVFERGSVINSVAWSLEIEVQFYLVAPLLCLAFAVRNVAARRGLLVAVLLAASLANELVAPKPMWVTRSLLAYLHYFLLGILLADWYLVEGRRGFAKGYGWDLAGIAAWLALGVGLIKVATPRPLLLPLILIAYMAAFRGRLCNAVFCRPILTTIGGMCYTIYLWHNLILHHALEWTWKLHRPGQPYWLTYLVQALLVALPLLAICAVLFALLERPFMRPGWWKRAPAR